MCTVTVQTALIKQGAQVSQDCPGLQKYYAPYLSILYPPTQVWTGEVPDPALVGWSLSGEPGQWLKRPL